MVAALRGGRARWAELLAVAKAAGGAKRHAEAGAAFLFEVGRHLSHPRLRSDMEQVVRGVMGAAHQCGSRRSDRWHP